jgi:alpha-1,2-mannosyltransferase
VSAGGAAVPSVGEPARSGPRVAWLASIALFGVLPAVTVATLFAATIQDGSIATDLRQFVGAAEAILDGESPYLPAGVPLTEWGGPYPYPPLPALAAIPLTVLPVDVAGVLVMAALVAAALATLRVLGVSDWRCYGLALLWPPVLSAVQTGNVTLWFGLAAALAWRYRDRLLPVSASIGLTLAVKFFLWPLVVWLAATRRLAGAVLSCLVGAALLLVSWAVIGFAGLVDYPDLVRRLEDTVGEDSYTLYIVGLDLGLPSGAARGLWLLLGLGLLAAVVVLGRRGDERSAFLLALAASIALTPIVWLHYFALLLVVVALAQPRLGFVWFVPLTMVITPGSGHPSPFETAATLAIAALTIGLALRASLGEQQRAPDPSAPVRATAEAA